MQIDIQSRKFFLTAALRNHVTDQLNSTFTRWDDHIQRITVRLSDINGPRGGEDKCCHLQISLNHLPDVVIEDTKTNLYVAIDRATERAEHSLVRRLERQQTLQRHCHLYSLDAH
jgi:ribosomal subunit interface protein